MNSLSFLVALALLLLAVDVSGTHLSPGSVASRHHMKVRSRSSRSLSRRCAPRGNKAKGDSKGASKAAGSKQFNTVSSASGLIQTTDDHCGASGATKETSQTSGPNGKIDWLNCGLEEGGWKPPRVTVDQVVSVPLSEAVKSPNSPFKQCSQFVPLFEKYAAQHGFSSTILAAFALQESSCNPQTTGGAGEQGLMQITKDKCTDAPRGDCKDPDFNVKTGAQFFADTLKSNNGDFLLSVGQYNGWSSGLTVGKATAAASTSCCRCQNNLDYLHQFVNGWLQNVDVYGAKRFGKYFNLDKCH